MQHIGLFGGSFNPVHQGHILAADSVRTQLGLDEIRFLPPSHSPIKTSPELSDAHRTEMLERAISGYPALKIDARELQRPGPSYTIDTLKEIAGDHLGDRLYLLIGMDAWEQFEHWHQWREIIKYCHLVVLSRPNYAHVALSEFWQEKLSSDIQGLKGSAAGRLVFVTIPASEAASNEIRERIKQGRSTHNDLPQAVIDYIQEQQLYRE
jgi:nicotinate-nucleotide adenylyltransferase